MKLKALVACSTLGLTLNVHAACIAPGPNQPAVAAGSTASHSEMYQSQLEIKAYVAEVEAFLECAEPRLDEFTYNFWATKAHSLADRYNTELRAFNERELAVSSR